jgi:hypothetical protein
MINVWLYLLGIIASIFVGFIIFAIVYYLMNWIMARTNPAHKLPDDKRLVSEFIAKNKDYLKDGGKEITTEKEEEHNERRKFARTREFEKLRRNTEFKESTGTIPRIDFPVPANAELQGRREFPILPVRNITRNDTGNKNTKRKLKWEY